MRRRDFLKISVPAVVAPAGRSAALRSADDVVILGPDQIKLSRVAMGTGTKGYAKSSNQTRSLGIGGLADLLRFGYDRGLRFWDSADGYGSHPHLKEALKSVPREKVAILTKTRARTAAEILGLAVADPVRVYPFPEAQSRYLHVMVKVRDTPERFPRRVGVAGKRPLGLSRI